MKRALGSLVKAEILRKFCLYKNVLNRCYKSLFYTTSSSVSKGHAELENIPNLFILDISNKRWREKEEKGIQKAKRAALRELGGPILKVASSRISYDFGSDEVSLGGSPTKTQKTKPR